MASQQAARIRSEQRARAEQHGQQVFWVVDLGGAERMALMYKPRGMLYYLDTGRQDWPSAFDGATLTSGLVHRRCAS